MKATAERKEYGAGFFQLAERLNDLLVTQPRYFKPRSFNQRESEGSGFRGEAHGRNFSYDEGIGEYRGTITDYRVTYKLKLGSYLGNLTTKHYLISDANLKLRDIGLAAGAENDLSDVNAIEKLLMSIDWTYVSEGKRAEDAPEGARFDDGLEYNPRGDDRFFLGKGDDLLFAGDGDDLVEGGEGDDRLQGGEGDDVLIGGPGDDVLRGGEGGDTLIGGEGADELHGGGGAEDIACYAASSVGVNVDLGRAGAQRRGDAKGDVLDDVEHLSGSAFSDVLKGQTAEVVANVFRGRAGDDRLWGRSGDDDLHGGEGDDVLRGGSGDDALRGGPGRDLMTGGAGDDALCGGRLGDTLAGGGGSNRFVYDQRRTGRDEITDWTDGYDRLDFSAIDGASFETLTIRRTSEGTSIRPGDGIDWEGRIALVGIARSDIDADDFIF